MARRKFGKEHCGGLGGLRFWREIVDRLVLAWYKQMFSYAVTPAGVLTLSILTVAAREVGQKGSGREDCWC
jgi:hypothetical protein